MTTRSRWVPIAAVLALALAVVACGDEGSVLGAGSSTTSTEAAATAPTTTEATTSTETTATTAAPTTTTTVPPTTTTSTTTTTTTTVPGPAFEFRVDGLGIADFGGTPSDVVDAVRARLGFNETADSGWGPAWGSYGACPGTEYRQVEFQGLVLQFTDADLFQPAGTRHFFAWSYDGTPAGIAPAGIDVGTTVADLQALYPTVVLAYDDLYFGDVFRVDPGVNGQQLWGMLTGPDPGDTVTYLTGGYGCGE
ncbi:MAG: hypothetical protein KQH83_05770 [Actinobacteria bacterium]|nr:hypothetical protein [Actinomycetota bacterium]